MYCFEKYKVYLYFLNKSLGCIRGEQLLKLRFVILVKGLQILNLVLMGLLVTLSVLFILLSNVNDFFVKSFYLLFKLVVGCSQLLDVGLHLVFLLLGHQRLSHAVSNR